MFVTSTWMVKKLYNITREPLLGHMIFLIFRINWYLIYILLSIFIWVITGFAYRANKKLPDDDPNKKEFHPVAIFLSPITLPLFIIGSFSLFVLKAILYGFAISSLIWIIIGIYPSIPTIVAGIVAFAIGEMVQAPRYYEYISEIAPEGQQGMYQGFAFLPIAIARFIGDPFGGWIYQTSKASGNPEFVWYSMIAIGLLATLLMYLYNKFIGKIKAA